MAKLTKITVDALEPRAERYEVADEGLPGFYIRVNRGGSKTGLVRYFVGGRPGAYTLGRLGEHFTLAAARAQARKILGDVARGKDPARERNRKRDAYTFAALAERFMSEHAPAYCKPTTITGYETILRLHLLPTLGTMKAEEIDRSDVERLHQRIGRTAPYMANRTVALLSSMMSKAEAWGVRPLHSNPCYRARRFRETNRERFLSAEERARLEETIAAAEARSGGGMGSVGRGALVAIRLLSLTGARCGEIIGLQWSMVDFERSRLVLPDSKTGAKCVPLSPQATAYLRDLERDRDGAVPWVCPSDEGTVVTNLQRSWRTIRKRAALDDVNLHDLRHSAASDMAAAGLSLPLIGRILGHKSPATTARYTHLVDTAQDEAARVMGDRIEQRTREGTERLRQERERAKIAAGAEHGEGETNGGEGEGATVIPIGATVLRFPGQRRG